MAKKLALAIAIEHYPEKSGQQRVKYALNDLGDICRYFKSADFDVTALKDEQADIHGIFEHLETFFYSVEPEDTVVIFYAGHGQYTEYGGFLIPHSYEKKSPVNESTCISFSSINDRLKKKKPAKFLLLLDTCYSGHAVDQIETQTRKGHINVRNTSNLIETEQLRAQEMARFTASEGRNVARAVLTSCRSGELSYHDDDLKHGVFTYFLLRGFGGGPGFVPEPDGKMNVDLAAVLPWVQDQVRQFSLERNRKQHPALTSKMQASFILPPLNIESRSVPADTIVVPPELAREIERATACIESGQFDQALVLVKEVLKKDPLNLKATLLEQEIGKHQAKEREEKKKEHKRLLDQWLDRGAGFLRSDQLDKAGQCFKNAQKIAPHDSRLNRFLKQLAVMEKSCGDTTLAKLKLLFAQVAALKEKEEFYQLLQQYDLIESIYPGNMRVQKERPSVLKKYFYARAKAFISQENSRIQKQIKAQMDWNRKLETLKADYEFVGMGKEIKEVTQKIAAIEREIIRLKDLSLSPLPDHKDDSMDHVSIGRFRSLIEQQSDGADPYLKEVFILLKKKKAAGGHQGSCEKEIIDPLTNGQFVYIPPGSFMMGSPDGETGRDDDEIRHKVTLTKGFYMQTTQVTQVQWEQVMGKNPSHFKGANFPVEQVSWDDVQVFISKLNRQSKTYTYRLPTEAEWEYACRSGSTGRYSFGENEKELVKYAWYNKNAKRKTHPVGQLEPNSWGLYDMHGNVWEWCSDGYDKYPSNDVTNPKGNDNAVNRVFRGGSWDGRAGLCRSAFRLWNAPGFRYFTLGFRLVLLFSGQK